MPKQTAQSATPIWAYTYQIDPPQPERLLRSVRALLDLERTDARAAGGVNGLEV